MKHVYEYTEDQKRKKYFVEHELKGLLMTASRDDIESVTYTTDGTLEIVTIIMCSGRQATVDVTCDSLMAIVYDVLKDKWWR